ncbi:ADP-ribosylglycohydrolase family protein [Chryseobacterium pennipullorum]|uniref:ADP-ribosylglycohydrolase family protein n=1 Tax=Chryseobacterium pennipullorum TaxID=2258963 RepID=UPI001E294A61|nr:ADP-ribosylglycohydrolase family protein [Chryseobacterium pennipullorum]
MENKVKAGIMGVCIGDALGVPVESYSETVLKRVNLGEDTDTTGAIIGGIAGIYYGFENIPEEWIAELVRKDDIEKLCEKLHQKLMN